MFSRTKMGVKILVVDDEVKNLQIVINHFESSPYELLHAPNGEVGCDIAYEETPDLILMDWAMPIRNGIDSILWLKAKSQTRDIPVVMTTGVMTTSEDLKEALEAGAIDFIRKPYDPLELTSRVEAALRLSQSYQEVKKKNLEIQQLLEREREFAERELAHKERELSIQAVNAHEKDQFLKEIEYRLLDFSKKDTPSEQDWKRLIKDIRDHTQVNNTWEKFMLHFEKVHPDFFNHLTSKHQSLTANELRMLAYIKIGMGNKEIATLTGVEPNSVKTFIYRLKKKMGLTPEDNLRDLVQQL